jgi:hypothetical protein
MDSALVQRLSSFNGVSTDLVVQAEDWLFISDTTEAML